jgi:alginate O-acetyltransferase complex protein AlgI
VLFQSIEFLVLFPLFLLLRLLLPKSLEKLLLVAASYAFYSWWSLKFVFLLLISTVVDYFCSKMIVSEASNSKKRKIFLFLSLFINLGVLFVFKYYVWVSELFGNDFAYSIVLPLGISFYTFQSMSYTIDVYRGDIKVEKSFVSFAAFVSFFPQLIAGPIERASNLLAQIDNGPKYKEAFIRSGLSLFVWGLIKKVVFADNFASLVNFSYEIHEYQSSLELLLSSYAFALQIYCDFSGYTDMARGIARLMGYELMQNFNLPYFASNIRDFWHKWHISLSTWFRDYVYIPLGGNRCHKVQNYFNIFLTMLIAGVWHGANMTFVVWGALHGIYIIIFDLTKNTFKNKIPKFISIFVTFHFVLLGWIFFRAVNIEQALEIISTIFHFDFSLLEFNTIYNYMICFALLMAARRYTKIEEFFAKNTFLNWSFIWLGLIAVVVFGALESADFIYFDF